MAPTLAPVDVPSFGPTPPNSNSSNSSNGAAPTLAPTPTLAALAGSTPAAPTLAAPTSIAAHTPAAAPTPAAAAAPRRRRRARRPRLYKYGWTPRGILGFGVEPGTPGHQHWLAACAQANPWQGLNARGRVKHAQEIIAALASRGGVVMPPAMLSSSPATVNPGMLSFPPTTVNPSMLSFPLTTVNPSMLSLSPAPGEMEAMERNFYAERRVTKTLARRAEEKRRAEAEAAPVMNGPRRDMFEHKDCILCDHRREQGDEEGYEWV